MGAALTALGFVWNFACQYWGFCADAVHNTVNFWVH